MKRLAPFLILAVLANGPAARADDAPAKVVTVLGAVTWHGPGSGDFTPAKPGQTLAVGSVVKTGARGMARLRWRNGGELRLNAMTLVTIADPDAVDLSAGHLWARFKEKLAAPFQFRGPNATAVVRGTTLAVAADAKRGTRVDVEEGTVEVSGTAGGRAMVGAGQSVKAPVGGVLGKVLPRAQAGEIDHFCDP